LRLERRAANANVARQTASKYNAQFDKVGAPTGMPDGVTGTAAKATLIAQFAVMAAVV